MTVDLPHPVAEAFCRPTWLELRAPAELRELRANPVQRMPGRRKLVVVVPGFLGSSASLSTLATWLGNAGHDVTIVDLERNVRGSGWAVDRIIEALDQCAEKPILIGHSRGGQQSRVATRRCPELVAGLITLGAPLRDHVPRHFALRGAVESLRLASRLGLYRPEDADGDDAYANELALPFEVDVPFTTIWSRTDGFVAWQQCVDEAAASIEIDCSHRGLVASRPAFAAIAQVLDA